MGLLIGSLPTQASGQELSHEREDVFEPFVRDRSLHAAPFAGTTKGGAAVAPSWAITPVFRIREVQRKEPLETLCLGALLEKLRLEFAGYELVAHWHQGE